MFVIVPPPSLSLSLSLLSSLSSSSLHFKSSSECQRPCGSALAAAFLCLSLSHSSCSHCLPASAALTLHRLLSLSLSLFPSPPRCPSLPRFLVFHSTADLGEIIVGEHRRCHMSRTQGIAGVCQTPARSSNIIASGLNGILLREREQQRETGCFEAAAAAAAGRQSVLSAQRVAYSMGCGY